MSFKPHLEKAHTFWKHHLKPTDHVIDATCGNGKDTRVLAEIVSEGIVYAIDIQKDAIEKSSNDLSCYKNIIFLHQCHTVLPTDVDISLVVYNLGYLPGGNKSFTSKASTTLTSLQRALSLIKQGGALSVTCYPGHAEGAQEEKEIKAWTTQLNALHFKVEWSEWRPGSPTLLIIHKTNINL